MPFLFRFGEKTASKKGGPKNLAAFFTASL